MSQKRVQGSQALGLLGLNSNRRLHSLSMCTGASSCRPIEHHVPGLKTGTSWSSDSDPAPDKSLKVGLIDLFKSQIGATKQSSTHR